MNTLPMVTLTHFHFDPLHVQLRLKLSKRTKDITQLLQNDPIHLKIIMHFFLFELLSLLVLFACPICESQIRRGCSRVGKWGLGRLEVALLITYCHTNHTIQYQTIGYGMVWYGIVPTIPDNPFHKQLNPTYFQLGWNSTALNSELHRITLNWIKVQSSLSPQQYSALFNSQSTAPSPGSDHCRQLMTSLKWPRSLIFICRSLLTSSLHPPLPLVAPSNSEEFPNKAVWGELGYISSKEWDGGINVLLLLFCFALPSHDQTCFPEDWHRTISLKFQNGK